MNNRDAIKSLGTINTISESIFRTDLRQLFSHTADNSVMAIGEYVLVIEVETGTIMQDLRTDTGHPVAGEEISFSGQVFVVDRVQHLETEIGGDGARILAHVYASPKRVSPKTAAASGVLTLLPLNVPNAPHGTSIESAILPASLVSVLVACGYRELATRYDASMRAAARLEREGQAWMVASTPPDVMEQLSRRAKRYLVETMDMMGRFRLAPFIT